MEEYVLVGVILHLLGVPLAEACRLQQMSLPKLLVWVKRKTTRATWPKLNEDSLEQAQHRAREIVSGLGKEDSIVLYGDEDYPPLLKEIPRPPYLLYLRGDRRVLLSASYSVVGSRLASGWGVGQCFQLGFSLACAGKVVVSGLARGIDAAVMRGHVAGKGKAVGVLGCGLDVPYPRATYALRQEVLRLGGCLVSLHPPGSRALPSHFPVRNSIISGLTMETVLSDVGFCSGASITANHALEQGREVCVIGYSPGTDRLAEEGAKRYSDAGDWLSAHGIPVQSPWELQGKTEDWLAEGLMAELEGRACRLHGRLFRRRAKD